MLRRNGIELIPSLVNLLFGASDFLAQDFVRLRLCERYV